MMGKNVKTLFLRICISDVKKLHLCHKLWVVASIAP